MTALSVVLVGGANVMTFGGEKSLKDLKIKVLMIDF